MKPYIAYLKADVFAATEPGLSTSPILSFKMSSTTV